MRLVVRVDLVELLLEPGIHELLHVAVPLCVDVDLAGHGVGRELVRYLADVRAPGASVVALL